MTELERMLEAECINPILGKAEINMLMDKGWTPRGSLSHIIGKGQWSRVGAKALNEMDEDEEAAIAPLFLRDVTLVREEILLHRCRENALVLYLLVQKFNRLMAAVDDVTQTGSGLKQQIDDVLANIEEIR